MSDVIAGWVRAHWIAGRSHVAAIKLVAYTHGLPYHEVARAYARQYGLDVKTLVA